MHILWDEFHSCLSLLCSILTILVCGDLLGFIRLFPPTPLHEWRILFAIHIYDSLNLSLWMCCIEGNNCFRNMEDVTTGDWAGNSSVHGGIHGDSIHKMAELSMVTTIYTTKVN